MYASEVLAEFKRYKVEEADGINAVEVDVMKPAGFVLRY